jgi:predicted amino acid dehydrogenase
MKARAARRGRVYLAQTLQLEVDYRFRVPLQDQHGEVAHVIAEQIAGAVRVYAAIGLDDGALHRYGLELRANTVVVRDGLLSNDYGSAYCDGWHHVTRSTSRW